MEVNPLDLRAERRRKAPGNVQNLNFGKTGNPSEKSNTRSRTDGINSQLDGAFLSANDPKRLLKTERPYHRVIIEMLKHGYFETEIAKATGLSAATVRNVKEQPWVQERMIREIKDDVAGEMKDFLEQEVMPSLRVIREIRDNEIAKPTERLAASNALLDRFLGKPTQPITQDSKDPKQLSNDELEQQVQRIVAGIQPAETDTALAG